MLTLVTYELSINPDIQQKLYEELVKTENGLHGKRIDYETLHKLKYLDQVVSESLRKWPAAPVTDRACTKDYQCEFGEDKKFRFENGVSFWIPIYGLHHDPKYYPEPEKFDPERFSDENKHKIVPGTYMPFGVGPRNCIGKYLFDEIEKCGSQNNSYASKSLDSVTLRSDGTEGIALLHSVELFTHTKCKIANTNSTTKIAISHQYGERTLYGFDSKKATRTVDCMKTI